MKKTAKQVVRGSDRAARDFITQLGGRLTRASGSGLEKGDGRVPGLFRVETKCPPTHKYRITYREWEKVWNAALSCNETALMHLKLGTLEVIILRTVDYAGFGGDAARVHTLGAQLGHTLSAKSWAEVSVYADALCFHLQDSRGRAHSFIAISRFDFIQLVEEMCP